MLVSIIGDRWWYTGLETTVTGSYVFVFYVWVLPTVRGTSPV